jgi:hypothetical protein
VSIQDDQSKTGEVVSEALARAVSATQAREADSVLYNPDNDFRKLALDVAAVSQGFRLVSKEDLAGVPHVIKRVIYRPGFPRNDSPGDYVSVEAVVADTVSLQSAPVWEQIAKAQNLTSFDQLKVFGNEGVIYNDSGTGIRRELTDLFERYSLINCGRPKADEVACDRPYQVWESGAELAQDGITGEHTGGKGGLYLALRGLQRSEYEYLGSPATTWYFG